MEKFGTALKVLVLMAMLVACKSSKNSELDSRPPSCSTLTLKGEPSLSEQGMMKILSIEVDKNSYNFFCLTAVISSKNDAMMTFGVRDLFHRSETSVKLDYFLFPNQSPDLSQLKIVLLNGLAVSKVIWSQSGNGGPAQPGPKKEEPGKGQGQGQGQGQGAPVDPGEGSQPAGQPQPIGQPQGTGQGDSSSQVACSYNINGKLYEGKSQAECDKLQQQIGGGF